jgi:hypothetical protein
MTFLDTLYYIISQLVILQLTLPATPLNSRPRIRTVAGAYRSFRY